ncbi:MAG: UDP-N-acetylmuramoylalanyl-D-glutamyl-2,6-diaminopimelate--D-alanyl-D-alanine ligase [Minwuia sp.]|uniref:UDP-N-acetylmuramoylalanyl-D-glutamyl-2, 6-diaminopimelate--D-alanyl-D-alanine ligase n=1 Tax=Minwuia sp. TaxID=2493630 RepID=UPI003A87C974
MNDIWTASEAAEATGGRTAGDWMAAGVSIDTRTIEQGDLFIAVIGENSDGHDWVVDALKKGAAAAVVHRGIDGADPARLLIVDDTMKALEALGRAARDRTPARVIGVTGSAGKTGCKEAIRHCLAETGARVHASERSYNNHWGVPLTLARMPRQLDFAVLEMGMNHAGEIAHLTDMVRPHVALITTIAPAHMAAFNSLDEIADAKAEIFQSMDADGVAVLPADLPQTKRLAAAARNAGVGRLVTFGADDLASVRLVCARVKPELSCVRASILDMDATFTVGLPGEHWVLNALGVLATVQAAGGDLGRAAPALTRLQPVDGRGARVEIPLEDGVMVMLDDSYNANPASMRAALSVLGTSETTARGRRIAVLGDMLELGDESAEMHAGLADAVIESGARMVFLCGPDMAGLGKRLMGEVEVHHAPTSKELAPHVMRAVRSGDVVLVKGSLGSRMAVIVEALRSLGVADRGRSAVV